MCEAQWNSTKSWIKFTYELSPYPTHAIANAKLYLHAPSYGVEHPYSIKYNQLWHGQAASHLSAIGDADEANIICMRSWWSWPGGWSQQYQDFEETMSVIVSRLTHGWRRRGCYAGTTATWWRWGSWWCLETGCSLWTVHAEELTEDFIASCQCLSCNCKQW